MEVHYTCDVLSGERVPVKLAAHFAAGLLERIDVETPEERGAYIAYAAQRLDDGEAMSLALAQGRHLALTTDDRRARLLIEREQGSIELARHGQRTPAVGDALLGSGGRDETGVRAHPRRSAVCARGRHA